MSRIASQFDQVFEGFAAELPFLTKLMLPGSIYFWLIPGIVILLAALNSLEVIQRSVVIALTAALSITSIGLYVVGLYLPIFQLGAVVSS
jgi:type II secretory pathway component PulF